uniref:Retrovirus-related Pol polyprotein from transposon TNT 1-94-like beta-barrel domain-containing protein n=1 Tax=Chenopodium quinoa TaxID=63459 RepID=A0A803MAV9_CHEQI
MRKVYRAEICAALALAEINTERKCLMEKVSRFRVVRKLEQEKEVKDMIYVSNFLKTHKEVIENMSLNCKQVIDYLAINDDENFPNKRYNGNPKVTFPTSLHNMASGMIVFDGSNFAEWQERLQFSLGVLDLDMALITEKPAKITNESTLAQVENYKAWTRSNRLSMMFMRITIASNIKTSLPATKSASEFLKNVEERFKSADKSLAGTLMDELTTMKYDGQKKQHILNMSEKAAKLKALGIGIDKSFLVQFILNSLPSQFEPFKIHYNANSEKWNLNELSSKCVQEEVRLRHEGKCLALNGFFSTQKPKESEKFLLMANRLKVEVHAVGTYCLLLETGHVMDLLNTFYVPSISRNLVSLSRLDYSGYNIVINSGRMDLSLNSVMVGSAILYDDKSKGYRFYFPNHSTRIVETGNAKFLVNGENSGSNELRKVEIEEIRVDIPPPFLPMEIVAPQPYVFVEDHEQHDGDSSLPPENIAIENDVEPPQPAALRRSQRERKSAISDDYVVYLQESDFDIGIRKDPDEQAEHTDES